MFRICVAAIFNNNHKGMLKKLCQESSLKISFPKSYAKYFI